MATYEIILRNRTSGAGKAKSPTSASATKSGAASAEEKQTQLISGVAAYGYAKKVITQVVSHRVNTVELRMGQAELQEKIALKYSIGRQAFGFLEGIVIGGGLAGVPGAIIGGIASLTSSVMNIALRQDTININRDLEDISISQNNIRAGAGNSRGDTKI